MRAGAPAVVAAGGVGVPARKWARVVEKLDDAHLPAAGACPFVIVDRPGLGRRGGRRFGDVPEFADEVARVVHDLRRCREAGASPVILVAHSAAGFLAEGAVRSNPGLVDGVLLLDVSVVEDAHLPLPLLRAFPLADVVYGRVSHAVGLVLEPLVRWAWPSMRRGEVASLLLENAVFGRWARDLRDLRAVDAAIGRVGRVGRAGRAGGSRRIPAVAAVTDVVAVPKRKLRAGAPSEAAVAGAAAVDAADAAADVVVAASRGRDAHLRTWRDLAGGVRDGEDPVDVAILAPCSHMVMTRRPEDVAAEIAALIARTSPREPA